MRYTSMHLSIKIALVLTIFVCSLSLSAQQDSQRIHVSFQIGASAYDFRDGNGLMIDSHWSELLGQFTDLPLLRLGLTSNRHNLAISYESFSHCYICPYYASDAPPNGVDPFFVEEVNEDFLIGFLQARSFKLLTLSYGYEVISTEKWVVTPFIGIAHRFNIGEHFFDGEYYIEEFLIHGDPSFGRKIPVYNSKFFNDWGPTAQLFIRYNILPWLSIAIKGEALRFTESPKTQIGTGAMLGFRW